MAKQHSEAIPKALQSTYAAVVELTDAFCQQSLNDEYAALCRALAAALARKRPSPLLRGQLEIWACAIVYALGTINFLFDRSQTPHISTEGLCAAFGVSKSSGANKAKLIRDMLGMSQFDAAWFLPSRIDESPIPWLIEVNGFIVDARSVPRDIQEIAYRKGLIPYIPVDRPQAK
jgi:Domain of unknown function (DUF6398)